MKQIRVLIFVFSPEEANAALQYRTTHPQEEVAILPASLSARLVLASQGVEPFDYRATVYKKYKNGGNAYHEYIKTYYRKATALVTFLMRKLTNYTAFGVDLILVLRLFLENEFLDVVFAYAVYESIKKNWRPTYWMFTKNLKVDIVGWDNTQFLTAAIIAKFFLRSEEIKWLSLSSSSIPSPGRRLMWPKWSLVEWFEVVGAYLLRFYEIYFKEKPIQKTPAKVNFLLFSAGYNLYYFNSLFAYLRKKMSALHYIVLTGEQSLLHEWLLRRAKIPFSLLKSLESSILNRAINREISLLEQQQHQLFSDRITHFFPWHLPLSFKKALADKFQLVLEKYTHKFVRQIALAKVAIDHFNPRLVITTHDPGPSALPFVLLAKRKHIPTLVFLHGFHDTNFGADHASDHLAGWGEVLRDRFVSELGKPSKSIFTVGFPFLDELVAKMDTLHALDPFAKKKKSPLKLGLLCTLYQIDSMAIHAFIFELFKALSKASLNVEVHLRMHAGQTLSGIKNLATYFGIPYVYNQPLTTEEFIKQTDIIYSWDTTAILWAAIYGKPLFYSTPWWGEGYIPVKRYQAAWVPKSAQDFISLFKRCISDTSLIRVQRLGQRRFIKETLGVVDGTATLRLAHLLQKLSE